MFAMHRYYRTRNVDSATYWFAAASLFSSTNIWISQGLQNAATEMGSKTSLAAQAAQQYHTEAYKAYVEKVASDTHALDSKVMPYMTKETG